jgi:predicted PurR-regulated permease PerM
VREQVSRPLAVAAAYAWRILIVVALLVVVGIAVGRLKLVILPLFVALLLATFLQPAVRGLKGRGVPGGLAAATVLATALIVLAGIGAAVGPYTADEIGDLDVSVTGGVERIQTWLIEGPLGLDRTRVDSLVDRAEEEIRSNADLLLGGVVDGAILVIELVAGALLALVLLFFILKDGERMWSWLVDLLPRGMRRDVDEMGTRAWSTLSGFLRGTAVVALVDAVGIAIALVILGVPLVVPLALITFVGGFIPIVGAFVAGFVAVMVALVSKGFLTALLVLGAIILVQQLESNLLQPVVVGRSVRLHPVVILLAVATGAVLWGIVGAFVAVPLTAAAWASLSYLRGKQRAEAVTEPEPLLAEPELEPQAAALPASAPD